MGTACACLALRALPRQKRLERSNFQGRTVSLRGGIAAAVGATIAASRAGALIQPGAPASSPAAAAVIAVSAGGAAGLADDLDAGKHDGVAPAKGLRGHLGALAHGRVTTGVLKIAVIGAGAAVTGLLLARDAAHRSTQGQGTVQLLTDAAVRTVAVAGWANLINLLDLRPGRALKACALSAAPLALISGSPATATSRLLASGVLAVSAASAPSDLAERTMLGDTGANALGALLGTALAAHPCPALRTSAATTAVALVLASEKVSFSRVIDQTPWLAALDRLGRQPS
ncbi:Uncharacterised protein [Actinomyces bovis]|uniref:Glycosyl transferase family 4 n=1 Tax=Actinomyces bovis TaxID=1658 RepID=A0ABY1VPW0_9ACTO|nr:Uncharacterised protein [Actinomyces bovis]VEG53557.1 Uncharacterised protein [Actinomyces israelii]